MMPMRSSRVRFLVLLAAASMSVLMSGSATAQVTVPIQVCSIIGPEFQFAHVPANTPVVLEMTDACTLSQPSGTVTFLSSDPLATLPSPLPYGAADVIATHDGWLFTHALLATFIFRSVGAQTLTISVSGAPYIVPMVVDPPATPVPALSALLLALLAIGLCVNGLCKRAPATPSKTFRPDQTTGTGS